MSEETLAHMVRMFKVLADANRLRILGILAEGPRSGGALADAVQLGASTVSHHLTRLREAGLVTVERQGTTKLYHLEVQALAEVGQTARPEQMARVAPAPRSYEDKVLSTFLDHGHLTKIPGSRKKRDVVLTWLVQRFAVGDPHSEAEVNEQIQQVHWDSATLRRELVGGGWMTRADGVYTRVR